VISFSIGTRVVMVVRVPLYIGFQAALKNDWRNSLRLFLPLPPLAYVFWHYVLSYQLRAAAENSRRHTADLGEGQTEKHDALNGNHRADPTCAWSIQAPSRPTSAYLSQPGCISFPMPYITLHPDIEAPREMLEELRNRSGFFGEVGEDNETLIGISGPRRYVSVCYVIRSFPY